MANRRIMVASLTAKNGVFMSLTGTASSYNSLLPIIEKIQSKSWVDILICNV